MDKEVIKILREYDNLVLDITEIVMKVRINGSPFRDATETDKLEVLKDE